MSIIIRERTLEEILWRAEGPAFNKPWAETVIKEG